MRNPRQLRGHSLTMLLDLFGRFDKEKNRRRKAIRARNREMKVICQQFGIEYKKMEVKA